MSTESSPTSPKEPTEPTKNDDYISGSTGANLSNVYNLSTNKINQNDSEIVKALKNELYTLHKATQNSEKTMYVQGDVKHPKEFVEFWVPQLMRIMVHFHIKQYNTKDKFNDNQLETLKEAIPFVCRRTNETNFVWKKMGPNHKHYVSTIFKIIKDCDSHKAFSYAFDNTPIINSLVFDKNYVKHDEDKNNLLSEYKNCLDKLIEKKTFDYGCPVILVNFQGKNLYLIYSNALDLIWNFHKFIQEFIKSEDPQWEIKNIF
eukprot:gene10674-3295_t